MIIPHNVWSLRLVAHTDNGFYGLNGVRLDRSADGPHATATNGKILAHFAWKEDSWEEFPQIGNKAMQAPPETWDGATIATDDCAKAEKATPRKTSKPILENLYLDEKSANGKVEISGTDLNTAYHSTITPIDAKYPEYTVALKTPVERTIRFNPRILRQAIELVIKTMPDCESITFGLPPEAKYGTAPAVTDKPITITAETRDAGKLTVLVMPLVLEG